MFHLLKCLAGALAKNGGKLLGGILVPGGEALAEIATDTWENWRKQRDEGGRRGEVQALAQASTDQLRQEVNAAVDAEAAGQPAAVKQTLAAYLMQVPAMIRRSLRRPSDPTGTTVPAGLRLHRAEDLLPLLPPQPPRFKPGDRPAGIGDWELVELLGVGGFGEVWKARHLTMSSSKPPVALKFCTDAEAARVLRNDAALLDQVMAEGSHPGIVRLQNSFLLCETPCLEFEYVAGGDLLGLMQEWRERQGGPTPEQATRVILRLAEIVAYVHGLKQPIVHRDLKPANILVQRAANGSVTFKVADFGIGGLAARQAIAQSTRLGSGLARYLTTAVRGAYSPLYASPQQIQGELPNPRDDVYALGVIWYQLLIGDFTQGAPSGLSWPQELKRRGMSTALIRLLGACVEGKAEQRPTNASVLGDQLAALLNPPPALIPVKEIVAEPVARRPRRPRPPAVPELGSGRKLAVIVCGVVLFVLALVLAFWAFSDRTPASFVNSIGMQLVLIPKGKFTMGEPQSKDEKSRGEDEHEVEITKAFYLGKYEVTKGEYAEFVRAKKWANPGTGATDRHPVANVSWEDAVAFCDWLSQKEGKQYRLPTEAEWEYSCRGGSKTRFSFGDNDAELGQYAWYSGNSGASAQPVGQKQPNAWGLYDMQGNVWEWCQDWYDQDYYRESPKQDPECNSAGAYRVLRGGSFLNEARNCRAAYRNCYGPANRDGLIGFRVVCVP